MENTFQGHNKVLRSSLFAVLSIITSGCNLDSFFSPEAKINSAIPVANEVLLSEKEILDQVDAERQHEIEQSFAMKLKLRALNCSKSYLPSWYTSEDEIRKQISNHKCFVETDTEMARWLGLIKVGIELVKPPLIPIPATPPNYIVNDETIQSVNFSEASGVGLVAGQKSIQIIDIASGERLFQEAKAPNFKGAISPNGRLFTTGSDNHIKIRSVETGAELVKIPSHQGFDFFWLDKTSAIFNQIDNNRMNLVDFEHGIISPLPAIQGPVTSVMRVLQADNQFILGSYLTIAKIELLRTPQSVEIKLINENPKVDSGVWTMNKTGLTSDGAFRFESSKDLTLMSVETMEQEKISFQPYQIQATLSTPDPDELLIKINPYKKNPAQHFLFSINDRTLTPIDRNMQFSDQFTFIPSLNKLGIIEQSKIEIIDDLPKKEPLKLNLFLAEALMEESTVNQEILDRQMESLARNQAILSRRFGSVGRHFDPSIIDLARNAEIEAIGVYQSKDQILGRDLKINGNVLIHVHRTPKPVILVLSAHEPVKWIISPEAGSRVSAVLLSGNNQQQLIGLNPSIPTFNVSSTFAFENGTEQYNKLDSEIVGVTGKHITKFQGKYEGSEFSAGGI